MIQTATCTACGATLLQHADDGLCPPCLLSLGMTAVDELPDSPMRPGWRRNLGPYLLQEQIGSGAFGVVWKALDPQTDRLVAIKIPRLAGLDEAETNRLKDKARHAARDCSRVSLPFTDW